MARWILIVAALALASAWAPASLAGEARFSEQALLSSAAPGTFLHFPKDQGPPKGFSAGDRLVATYYFYWYDHDSLQHFRNSDGSDGMTDHPADPSGCSYKRPAWHKKQLEDMMEAGIDIVLPVFWGCPANPSAKGGDSWSCTGLPPLVAAEEELLAAGRKPPRIGMFYDTSTLQHNAAGHRVDLSTPDGRAWFYVTIRDFFSLIPAKLWATIDGRPIVFLYAAGFEAGGRDDPQLIDYVGRHFAEDFGGARPYIVADQTWRFKADNTYSWGAAFGLKSFGVASVGPGYDDRAVPGRASPKADREGGAFYRRLWETLLAMDPARRPHLVTIETWNEWHEATDIAESREYGRQYIDMTRGYAAVWKAGERRKPTGPYAAAAEVSITFGPGGKSVGIRLQPCGDGESDVVQAAGSDCIATRANQLGNAKYLYFDVDDTFYFDSGGALEVLVEYLDEGTAAFILQYDSADATATLDGAYKDAGTVKRTDTGQWKTATFMLKDARFINRENGASDFRLHTVGTLKVRKIIVRRPV